MDGRVILGLHLSLNEQRINELASGVRWNVIAKVGVVMATSALAAISLHGLCQLHLYSR